MREELRETRNRWQEAIASREALTSEVGNATTPLLRQITSLQETLRIKTDSWQKVSPPLPSRCADVTCLWRGCRWRVHYLKELSEQRRWQRWLTRNVFL
jgi:hypothetical protein